MQIKWPVLLLLVLFAGAAFTLFYTAIENFFVFFPDRAVDPVPETFGLAYKNARFSARDGVRLHGWYFPGAGEKGPVMLFCHGNAGNISHRLENVRLLVVRGFRVFIFDYRGYGKSTGKPSEDGIYSDGIAAYDYLVGELGVDPGDIIAFGRSLGAAVALEIALQKDVRSLVLESAFTSTKDMARAMPLFGLIAPLLPAHYNNLGKVSQVKAPTLFIHGREDEIVPFAMGQRLFEAAAAPKFFFALDGAGHNDTYITGGSGYFDILMNFAEKNRISANPS